MKLVSVLLPVYNAENSIVDTLLSIKEQTYKNYELVIVDDGCTDNSIQKAFNIFPYATVVRQKNGGITKALNHGIKYCKGDYIARIDCGDLALPTRFEQQVKYLNENSDVGVVGGHMILFEKDGSTVGTFRFPTSKEETKNALLNGLSSIPHTGAMIRKEKLIEAGCYDEFYNGREDYELWLRLSLYTELNNIDSIIMKTLSTADGISYKGVLLYPLMELALIEREERLTKGFKWKNEKKRIEYLNKIEILINKKKIPQKRIKAMFLCKRAGVLFLSGERKNSLKQYIKGVTSDKTYFRSWFGIFTCLFISKSIYQYLVKIIKKYKKILV